MPKNLYKNFRVNFSTLFGLGNLPLSGIIGTLFGIMISYILSMFKTNQGFNLIVIVIITILGTYSAHFTISYYKKNDPSQIIIDEVVGSLIASLFIKNSLQNLALVFILFRLFDNLKPFPISLIDKKTVTGWGIMADDILAGIFTCTCILALNHFL